MFDHIVLTASNEGQARAYRAELGARGFDAHSTPRAHVVADPGGRRVGSGVSTLLVLAEIAAVLRAGGKPGRTIAELFTGERVCIIHCGGDSRRLPAYAAQGKIFAPLPIESGRPYPPALFDLLLDDFSRIDLPDEGRVVVATGDVFLDLGGFDLGFERPGVVGVAWPDSPQRGSRHGVYITDAQGSVTGFLHKPTHDQVHAHGAIRPDGNVLIDTGVLCLDPMAVEHWLTRAGVSVESRVVVGDGLLKGVIDSGVPAIDLYGDILPAMAHNEPLHGIDWRSQPPAQAGEFSSASRARGTGLSSPRLPFAAAIIPTCPFLHIGSSGELLDVLTGPQPPTPRWQPTPAHRAGTCVYNSTIPRTPTTLGRRVVVEGCHLASPPSLPGSNIVVGVPRELETAIELSEGWGLVCLPVGGSLAPHECGWVALCFGESDDFKTPLTRSGTFGNRPLQRLLDSAGMSAEDLWPGLAEADHTLWTAKLWTPTGAGAMLEPLRWMLDGAEPSENWLASQRISAGEVMTMVDHARLREARDRVFRGD